MFPRPAICTLAFLLACISSPAAELFYIDHDPFTDRYQGPTGPLVISGEIIAGDTDRLLAKITADEIRFMLRNKII